MGPVVRVWQNCTRVGHELRFASPPLSPSQQEEMNGAIVMTQEAMDQVSGGVVWRHS